MALVVEYFDVYVNELTVENVVIIDGTTVACVRITLDMTLRIKELRKAKKLTQQSLAEMALVSRSQLAEIENETKPVNTRRLTSIAKALGVPVEDLFSTPTESGPKASKEGVDELLNIADDLGQDELDLLLRLARSFAAKS